MRRARPSQRWYEISGNPHPTQDWIVVADKKRTLLERGKGPLCLCGATRGIPSPRYHLSLKKNSTSYANYLLARISALSLLKSTSKGDSQYRPRCRRRFRLCKWWCVVRRIRQRRFLACDLISWWLCKVCFCRVFAFFSVERISRSAQRVALRSDGDLIHSGYSSTAWRFAPSGSGEPLHRNARHTLSENFRSICCRSGVKVCWTHYTGIRSKQGFAHGHGGASKSPNPAVYKGRPGFYNTVILGACPGIRFPVKGKNEISKPEHHFSPNLPSLSADKPHEPKIKEVSPSRHLSFSGERFAYRVTGLVWLPGKSLPGFKEEFHGIFQYS